MRPSWLMLFLAFPCAAQAQWGTWSTNWHHRELRSNLWAALSERYDAAGVAYAVPAPGWWVSRTWLSGWDEALTNILPYYADMTAVSTATVARGVPMLALDVSTLTNGLWWPRRADYAQRRACLEAATTTVGACVWQTNGIVGSNYVARYSDGWSELVWIPPPAEATSPTWADAKAAKTNYVYEGLLPMAEVGVVGSVRKMSQAQQGSGGLYGYSEHVGYAAPYYEAAELSTNFAKQVRFWWAGLPPQYWTSWGVWDAAGSGITSNWSPVASCDADIGYASAWTNEGTVGDTGLGDPPVADEPAAGAWSGKGWVGYGFWFFNWTAQTNGFKYR